jgi:hypothetical protein
MGKAESAYPRGFDFEQFWAGLQETRKLIEEVARHQEETDRQMKETDRRMQETDRQMQETDRQLKETAEQMKETDKRMQETDKRIGKLTGRFGEVVEQMMAPNLAAKFRDLGFEFEKTTRNTEIVDRKHDIILETDAFLENGLFALVVEIKSKPSIDDVDYHIEKMGKLRKYADLKGDPRKYLGAMAGVVFSESVSNYALKNGLYVIEPSGDALTIIEPKGKYKAREW